MIDLRVNIKDSDSHVGGISVKKVNQPEIDFSQSEILYMNKVDIFNGSFLKW